MIKLRTLFIALALSGAFISVPEAKAEVPSTLAHQGRLLRTDGTPVDEEVQMIFSLYSSEAGGAPIWTEFHAVAVTHGWFSVALGADQPFGSVFSNGSGLFLGVTVDQDDEMYPRTRIGSVPYALVSSDVVGNIHPKSVSIGSQLVIDDQGNWVGPSTNLVGPVGPSGAAGARGEPGAMGPAGPAGADGARGEAGATGATGMEGPMGPVGPIGPSGPAGSPGVKGDRGAVPVASSEDVGPNCESGGVRYELEGEISYVCNGLPGLSGAPGVAGAQGEVGPVGPMGAQGAPGAVGPQGEIGLTGPVGPQGTPGVAGPQGETGLTGPIGPVGPQGIAGLAGPQGETGLTGPMGPVGPQGAPGLIGPQGETGLTGLTGPVGPMGPTGLTGPIGLTGPVGPQGTVGLAGPQGAVGPVGLTGPIGPQGTPGEAGPQGAVGPIGPAGAIGPQGAAGPQGPMGLKGDTGDVGPAGLPGATGPQGPAGIPGVAGPQGVAGLTGPAGATGAQGPIGLPGPMGATGAMGSVGPVGPAGAMGPQGLPGTSVVAMSEGPGPNCTYGGASFAVGSSVTYACNGAPGATGANGATGATGATGPAGSGGGGVVVRDANNVLLGKILSMTDRQFTFLSSTGYLVTLAHDGSIPHSYYVYYPSAGCGGSPAYMNGSSNRAVFQKISAKVAYYLGASSQWAIPSDPDGDGLNLGVNGATLSTASGYHQTNATPCGTSTIPSTNWGHLLVPTTAAVLGLPSSFALPFSFQ